MAPTQNKYRKCSHCGAQNDPKSSHCNQCGRRIHYDKIKLAKKIFKGSRVLIKSTLSRKYREKTVNKVMGKMYGINMNNFQDNMGNFNNYQQNMGNFSNQQKGDYGYLLCDSCPIYYKLDHPQNSDDPKICGCGGNLIYSDKPRPYKD